MFEKVRKLFHELSFKEIDKRKIHLGWQGDVSFSLWGNPKTGDQYALLQCGGEAAIRLDTSELASIIGAAKGIYDQMR